MTKIHWWLLILYLAAAAGYGGWRGKDLWSSWSDLWLLLPPLAWGALKTARDWRRSPYWVTIYIGLTMTAAAVVAVGGQALALAWVMAEGTARFSPEPAVRAIASAGIVAATCGLAWALKGLAKPHSPQDASGAPDAGGAAGTESAQDHFDR